MQYDIKKDVLVTVGKSKALYDNISLFTGMTNSEISKELAEKVRVLNYLVKKNIDDVDGVGRIVAEYYTAKDNLMKYVNSNADFPLASQLFIEPKPDTAFGIIPDAGSKDLLRRSRRCLLSRCLLLECLRKEMTSVPRSDVRIKGIASKNDVAGYILFIILSSQFWQIDQEKYPED